MADRLTDDDDDVTGPGCWIVTGVSASGKSTVGEALARRFPRSVHLRGDVFRTMIVSGRDAITEELGEEAIRQLELRRRIATGAADEYARSGFTVVLQDIYGGSFLTDVVNSVTARPLHVVVLAPTLEVVGHRERARAKTGYAGWDMSAMYDRFMAETPRIGLWLDTSSLTVTESVDAILDRREESRVR
jgi:chloramphenicol 3-O-phosphotransferase